MADVAAVPATPKTKKGAAKPKKAGVKKPAASHPPYGVMIAAAIKVLKDKKGSSRQAIVKYVVATYKIEEKSAVVHIRMSLKRGVANKSLRQVKGIGASGRFKLPESTKASPKKKAVKKTPKKAAKKPAKKATPKKSKSPKKPKKAKTPKKPAAKKARTPKKPAAKTATKAKK